jgi:hypothetical protein
LERSRPVVSGVIAGAAQAPSSALTIPPEHPDFQDFFGEPAFDRETIIFEGSRIISSELERFLLPRVMMTETNKRFKRVVNPASRPNDPICDDLVCISR